MKETREIVDHLMTQYAVENNTKDNPLYSTDMHSIGIFADWFFDNYDITFRRKTEEMNKPSSERN